MKLLKNLIAVVVLAVSSLPAMAELTTAQYQTLATHIRANTDPAVVAALAGRVDNVIAEWYNGVGSCVIWRNAVRPSEYREAIVWSVVDGLTAGKREVFVWMTQGLTIPIDATKPNIRQGIADVFGAGSATGIALVALSKRNASRFEDIWATGTCTTQTPGAIPTEGPLQVNDVSRALNEF